MRGGEDVSLLPQVKHSAQREVKEVSAPTSRVKDAHLGQFLHPGEELVLHLRAELVIRAAFDRLRLRREFLSL